MNTVSDRKSGIFSIEKNYVHILVSNGLLHTSILIDIQIKSITVKYVQYFLLNVFIFLSLQVLSVQMCDVVNEIEIERERCEAQTENVTSGKCCICQWLRANPFRLKHLCLHM